MRCVKWEFNEHKWKKWMWKGRVRYKPGHQTWYVVLMARVRKRWWSLETMAVLRASGLLAPAQVLQTSVIRENNYSKYENYYISAGVKRNNSIWISRDTFLQKFFHLLNPSEQFLILIFQFFIFFPLGSLLIKNEILCTLT